MLQALKNAIESFREPGALTIQLSDEWRRTEHGTRWTHVEDVNGRVKLRKELVEEHERPRDGETATLVRIDDEVEWFDLGEREEWPEYVRAARENGEVYADDLDLDFMDVYCWPSLISYGGSTWNREE